MAKKSIGRMTRFCDGAITGSDPARESSLDWLERVWRDDTTEALSVERDGSTVKVVTTDGHVLEYCWQP